MGTIHREPGLAKGFTGWAVVLIALAISVVAPVLRGQETYELVYAFRNPGNSCPLGEKQNSSLIHADDGYFYGTTCGGGKNGVGTIFRVDSQGNLISVHSFGYADGANPIAGLVQGSDGTLYGTTSKGGTNNLGVVFKMDFLGNVTRLHSFTGTDGENPYAGLMQASDGMFYGTTNSGGAHEVGTIFQIDTSGDLTTLHHFNRYVNGARPAGELIQATDGLIYGTTSWGGSYDEGSVFSMDSASHVVTLHSFKFGDGARPVAALVEAADGNFYGTTVGGGTSQLGTVFRVDPSGGFSSLHSFNLADGAYPEAALIQASDGGLYGTTSRGDTWSGGWGTVFKVETSGDLTTVHSFTGSDGAHPRSALVEASDGNLFGTTDADRIGADYTYIAGAVFKMSLSGDVTTLHELTWTNGVLPGSLIQSTDGHLYGTTAFGGTNDFGTIFGFDFDGTRTGAGSELDGLMRTY